MSQFDFAENSSVPSPQRANGPAIASLVCGILGCFPILTSLLAVILGIVGLRKTRDPQVGGKGLAISGLILGVLGLGFWSVVGVGVVAVLQASAKPVAVAEQFTRDLSTGNVDAAFAVCAPGMDRAAVQSAADSMKPWGPLTTLSTTSRNVKSTNGRTHWDLGGTATFAHASKSYTMTLIPEGMTYRVVEFHFSD